MPGSTEGQKADCHLDRWSVMLASARDRPRIPARTEVARMSETILLAEDNAGRAEDVRAALASRGFPVVVAADGAEALGRAAEIHPLAIVSDVLMPNMDGFELCWEIRRASALSGTPVILTTTGWADRDSSQFARDVGANAFVDKGMVLDTIDSVLESPADGTANACFTSRSARPSC